MVVGNIQLFQERLSNRTVRDKMSKCQMYVYIGRALSYTKLVHRHATQTEGNKYFK